ncbi:SGNH/GDSL hydrolase family protein [Pleurocapsales cyanobacterium LEGE 06147]|nr:SGNH/GDSL hydrolase family protein [Pleurocapsales cyanobacterium LEGE 06147]
MKKQIFIAGIAVLSLIMIVFINSAQNFDRIDELYVFGDSLSDVGNVFEATGGAYPPNPPYFQGRYSNGRLWVEHLADKLELSPKQTANFAWGGATSGINSNDVPGLLAQVQSFIDSKQEVNPQALATIWSGANDYLHGATNPIKSVENLSRAIALLSQAGIKNILVANLPDLGQLPATRNNPNSETLTALTNAHNLNLSKSLDELKQQLNSDTQIIEFDVYSLYQEAITNPAKFGFINVSDTCLNQSPQTPESESNSPQIASTITVCERPAQFLFWDGIHPTAAAHQILAEKAFLAIK